MKKSLFKFYKMFESNLPLPPLKASNQRASESILALNIRSEISKIQQSLQRSNQLYIDYFSDVPFDISESLRTIQESQNSISKKVQKNKLEEFKKKTNKYFSKIDSLTKTLQNHINSYQISGQTDFFAENFPSFEKSLITQNQIILENLEKKLFEKIDEYEKQMKMETGSPQYKFELNFSNSSKQQAQEKEKNEVQTFSTLNTVLDLERHNRRLQSLEDKIEIAVNQQKEIRTASEKDVSRQIAEKINENHEKIRNLLIKSQKIKRRIEHPPPPIPDEPPPIKFRKKSNIEQYEFDQFSNKVNESNDRILAQIEYFENFSEQKISGFNQSVEMIEQKVADFEASVSNLNDLLASVNQKIEDAEDNFDDLVKNKKEPQFNHSDLSIVIDSFKTKLAEIQNEARDEIEKLKLQLNLLESKCSV